jgi:hypothetical protein
MTVSYDDITRPSYVSLTIDAPTPDAATAAFHNVVGESDQVVASIQTSAGANPDILYAAVVGSPPSSPVRKSSQRLRAAGAALGGGVLVGLVLLVMADGFLLRRGKKRVDTARAMDSLPPEEEPETAQTDSPVPASVSTQVAADG